MINIPSSPGVKLALLEAQLLSGEIDRSAFLERTSQLGLAGPDAASVADKFLAIAANQAARRESLRASYDLHRGRVGRCRFRGCSAASGDPGDTGAAARSGRRGLETQRSHHGELVFQPGRPNGLELH